MMNRELIGPTLFLLLFVCYGIYAWQIPLMPFEEYESVNSASLPKLYTVLGIVICLLAMIAEIVKSPVNNKREIKTTISWKSIRQTLLLIILMLLYSGLLESVGFVLSTALFLLFGFWLMGERRKKTLLLASIPVVIIFWIIMTQLLGVYLAPGEFWS
ncbi:tripartite tricarboxylate transporter TctB family protein [Shewanella indica]